MEISRKVKTKIRKLKKSKQKSQSRVNTTSIGSIQFKDEHVRQRRWSLFLVAVHI